jgi:hypothetical protein
MTPVTQVEQIRAAAKEGKCLLVNGTLYPAMAVYRKHSLAEVCQLITVGAVLAFDRRDAGVASC